MAKKHNNFLKKTYKIIKNNTAQIALILPIIIALGGVLSNVYSYLIKLGYYDYFRIDSQLLVSYGKDTLYQYFAKGVLCMLYWGYAIFAARMWLLKENWGWKIISFIIVPFIINLIFIYYYYNSIPAVALIACFIMILLHWLMIFAMGYCIVYPYHLDISKRNIKNNKKKNNKKTKSNWGNKEFFLLGIMLIVIGVIGIFYIGYRYGNMCALQKNRFGIIEIEEQLYVVIDVNGDDVILQKCEINDTAVMINTNTYLCFENHSVINYTEFNHVYLKR